MALTRYGSGYHVTPGFSAPKFELLFCGFADDCYCCCRCRRRRLVNCYPVAARWSLLSLSPTLLFASRPPCPFPPRPQLDAADSSSVRPPPLCAFLPPHICLSGHPAGGGSQPSRRLLRLLPTPRSLRLLTRLAN